MKKQSKENLSMDMTINNIFWKFISYSENLIYFFFIDQYVMTKR